jgi:hypothetical protein
MAAFRHGKDLTTTNDHVAVESVRINYYAIFGCRANRRVKTDRDGRSSTQRLALTIMVLRWARLPVLLLAVIVYFISTFANAHTIEVAASQKECFFEDLHVHDQVPITPIYGFGCSRISVDDSYISSRRWWTYGYRLLGELESSASLWRGSSRTRFQLSDPTNMALNKQYKQSTGSVSITAKKDGRYEYCFSNVMSTIADKVVRCAISLSSGLVYEANSSFLMSASMFTV